MKRFTKLTIIMLGLLLSIAPLADAKGKKTSTSTTALSLARLLANSGIEIDFDNPQQVKQLTGMDKIYYKKEPASRANNMEEGFHYIYGKNAKVSSAGKKNVIVKATGPNAFYYEANGFYNTKEEYGSWSWSFNFRNKADRDKFWNEYKDEPYAKKGYKNGWYWVSSWTD